MATSLKITAGNSAPSWIITCQRAGVPINLTGCTVTLNISDGSIITRTNGVAVITSATTGLISYQPTATDCPIGGNTYLVDVKIVYSDASLEILYEQLKVKTRAALI